MKQLLLIVLITFSYTIIHAQTYITNTNVVDVINMKIDAAETVVVKNGKIINVDKSDKIKIPSNATIIDGSSKYLTPGFVDAHVHFFQTGGLYTRPDVIDLRKYEPYNKELEWTHQHMEDFLRRYLAAGITTVIDPGSSISFLKQRDSFKTKTYAPAIFMTGPLLTTYEPDAFKGLGDEEPFFKMETEEDARKYVQKELPYKPDFIKIWYIIPGRNPDSTARAYEHLVKAVIDEAHKNKLKVAVHATQRVAAQLAVEDGADYLVHSVDDEIIDENFVQLLKKHNVVLCPTLQVMDDYFLVFSQQYQPSDADKTFANPVALNSLFDLPHISDTAFINQTKSNGIATLKIFRIPDSNMMMNLKKLADAGVTIATGTDAGNIGTMHASSYFNEIQKMRQAGMSVAQILQASTINGAKVLGKENEFGSIEKDKNANMILLDANPLEDLDNWRKIFLVINKGKVVKPNILLKELAVTQ